jgi:iron(III) transport system permease protein
LRLLGIVLAGFFVIILAYLILSPITLVLLLSIQSVDSQGVVHYSLSNFATFFQDRFIRNSLAVTFSFAISGALFATIVGVFVALLVARTNMPLRKTIEVLAIVSFFLPTTVTVIAWTDLASGRIGIINSFLDYMFRVQGPFVNVYTFGGAVFVGAIDTVPYVYLLTIGSLRNMDSSLEEAARISGSSMTRTLLRVTLPLAAPAIVSGGVFVFIFLLGMYVIPYVLGSQGGSGSFTTLSVQLVQFVETYPPNYGMAATLSIFILVPVIIFTFFRMRLSFGRKYAVITGKLRPTIIDLGPWKWVAFVFAFGYAFLAVILPYLMLVLISFQKYWSGSFQQALFTLGNFELVLSDPVLSEATRNGLFVAGVGATIGVLVGVSLSYLIDKSRIRGRAVVRLIILVPITIPGIVLGLGLLRVWVAVPLIFGSLWIIILGYIIGYLAYAFETISSAMLKVSGELEESSRISGASSLKTMTKITFPLLKPALAASWLLLFILFMKELGISLLLVGINNNVLSVAILGTLSNGGTCPCGGSISLAILSLLLSSIVVSALALFLKFFGVEGVTERRS